MTKYTNDDSNFGARGPFFRIIQRGLEGLAEGDDYFDLLADDVTFEYVISVPDYPRRVEGRRQIIYSGSASSSPRRTGYQIAFPSWEAQRRTRSSCPA
jgi:hypothetical protein